MDPLTIASIVGLFLGPLMSYFVAARQMSGRIQTSAANDLWDEAEASRADYRARLAASDERQARLELRVANLESDKLGLLSEKFRLERKVWELERLVEDLQAQLKRVEEQNGRG